MSDERTKAKSIFLNAAEIASVSQRQAYVAGQCGADEALAREVEDLLRHREGIGSFLKPPAADPGSGATLDARCMEERPGAVIGRYRLMEQIGEGGFGLVFVAEQQHPVRRKVALKV